MLGYEERVSFLCGHTWLSGTRSLTSNLIVILLYWPNALSATNESEPIFHLEPIVITAEKRRETVGKTPLSMSVVTNDRLQSYGITTIKDVSFLIPNLYISEFTARRTSFPYIRGLGSGQGEPVITTYIDGVPQLTPNTTNIELLDIDRIEFIRGPQGTLYGRNTLGGVIHIITKAPSGEKQIDTTIDIGEVSLERYKLVFNTPLALKNSAFTVATSYIERDGYFKNDFTGNTVDDQQALFGRATLRLTPADRWDLSVSIFGERDRDGDFVLFDLERIRKDPYHIDHDFEGKTDRDIIAPTVSITRYGAILDFLSITGYEHWSATDLTDLDFTQLDLLRRRTNESQSQFYQELRLQSSEDSGVELSSQLSLKWLSGISFFYSDFDHDSYNELRPALTMLLTPIRDVAAFDLEGNGVALFGQGTLTFYEKLDVNLALRLDYEHRDTDLGLISVSTPGNVQRNFNDDFTKLLPKIGLTYHWNDNLMAYGYAAEGFRAGGYNRNLAVAGNFKVDEEESWTYETGLKTTLFEDRVAFNLALFYIDWSDMQLDVRNTAIPIPGSFFLDNVGESESKGFEVELRAQGGRNWDLFGGFGYTSAEFKDYFDENSQQNLDDNTLPNVPEFTWNIGVQNQFTLNEEYHVFVNAEVAGIGKLFFDSANSKSQNDYVLTNFRAGIGGKTWSLEAWIKNAFDEEYVVLGFPSPFSPSGFVGQSGIPQTVGVSLRFMPTQWN